MTTDTVRAAAAGDLDAFTRLVERYASLAAAVALARTGRPQIAEEVAQEAFLEAWRSLPSLRDPAAFPAWLRRVVVKHADRVTRRKRHDTSSLERVVAASGADPEADAAAAAERRGVLRALAELPPHQREVCALFYLSDRSQAEIADLLGLSIAATKKRLHDARRRLHPILEDPVTWSPAALPRTVRAFVAARIGRLDVLEEALEADPELIMARATLDPEALQTRYVPPGAGMTLLHEAVSYGQAEIAGALLDRGAALEATTTGGQTPLLLAVEQDHPGLVALLLARGADPDATMWHGGTALHIAARRRRRALADQLLAAGADPQRRDAFGRIPGDWAQLAGPGEADAPRGRVVDASGRGLDGQPALPIPDRSPAAPDRRVCETRIKALDVLAPLTRGGVHRLVAGAGVGKIVLIGELARNLGPTVVVGLLDRTWDVRDFEAVLRELGAWDGAVVVLGTGETDHAELARTSLALAELAGGWVVADERLLSALADAGPGVPVVAFGPHVLPDPLPDPGEVVAQWVLDPRRAARREYPALDPQRSSSSADLSPRHAELLSAAHAALDAGGERAAQLLAWLTQPFACAEGLNGRPGVQVSLADALDDLEALLGGAADAIAVDQLRYLGTLDSAPWPTAPGGLL